MKKELLKIYEEISRIYEYDNKNLTKKQYYKLAEIIENFENVLKQMED